MLGVIKHAAQGLSAALSNAAPLTSKQKLISGGHVPSTVGLVAGSNAILAAMWSSLVVGLSAETAPNTRLR